MVRASDPTARNLLFLKLEIRAWLRQGDKGVEGEKGKFYDKIHRIVR